MLKPFDNIYFKFGDIQGLPPLRPEAIEERVPDPNLPCIQTDDYLKYHHRTVIQQQIENRGSPTWSTGLSSQGPVEE